MNKKVLAAFVVLLVSAVAGWGAFFFGQSNGSQNGTQIIGIRGNVFYGHTAFHTLLGGTFFGTYTRQDLQIMPVARVVSNLYVQVDPPPDIGLVSTQVLGTTRAGLYFYFRKKQSCHKPRMFHIRNCYEVLQP